MTPEIERLYQRIGSGLADLWGGQSGRMLLYAEVDDASMSTASFRQVSDSVVALRFPSHELERDVQCLWREWKGVMGNAQWRGLTYLIEGGEFHIGLLNPESFRADEFPHDRQPRIVEQFFGPVTVDDSDAD